MKYFEDYEIGDIQEGGAYQITKDEIVAFARQWDPQPFHIDEEAARASVFGEVVACGPHIYAISSRLAHIRGEKIAAVAGLGIDEMRFHNPVRPGDIISQVSRCIDKRISESNPGHGILTMLVTLKNQHNETLFSFTNSFLVERRSPG